MATVYYEILYGDDPFSVRITGNGVDITEARPSIGTYLFTDLEDGDYVISVTSSTGCTVSYEVTVACATTTTSTTLTPPTTTTTTTELVCDVYAEIVSLCEGVEQPTTTTTSTSSTTTTSTTINPEAVIECLEGFTIEAIYMRTVYDYSLLPPEYVHPCYYTIGTHTCNRSLFEVYGNGNVYVGDFRMNNDSGVGGGITAHSGNEICRDYNNVPHALTGGYWGGTAGSRYDKITLTYQQALDIATATGGGTMVTFSMIAAMSTYGASCSSSDGAHSGVTWIRMTKPNGEVIYNGCPDGNFVTLDVCTGAVSTTTTTTLPVNTYFVYYDAL